MAKILNAKINLYNKKMKKLLLIFILFVTCIGSYGQGTWMAKQKQKMNLVTVKKAVTRRPRLHRTRKAITHVETFPVHSTEDCISETSETLRDGKGIGFNRIKFEDSWDYKDASCSLSVSADFPTAGNEALLSNIKRWIADVLTYNDGWTNGYPITSFSDDITEDRQMISFRADNLKDAAKDFMNKKSGEYEFNVEWDVKLINEEKDCITYRCDFDYTDGDRDTGNFKIMTFRKSDGKMFTNGQIFNKGVNKIGEYSLPNANAYVSGDGVTFLYNDGESTDSEVNIPFSIARDYMQTDAVALSSDELGEQEIEGIKYLLGNGEAYVFSQHCNGQVIIPETVSYRLWNYKVTSMSDGCFNNNVSLTSVSLPNTITEISDNAFNGCCVLNEIKLPNNLKNIGNNAFSNCTLLSNINFPASVEKIGNKCFSQTSLANIKLPQNAILGEGCFSNCKSLVSVTLPSKMKTLFNSVFEGCTRLTSITIPPDVENINNAAFKGCSQLNDIKLSSSLKFIGDDCFLDCVGMQTIALPENIISIGNRAFKNCKQLKDINIPSNIEKIGDECFRGCGLITSITFPPSLSEIGKDCFCECGQLINVTCYWMSPDESKLGYDIFTSINPKAVLFVPKGAKKNFKDKFPWNVFDDIKTIKTDNKEIYVRPTKTNNKNTKQR
jgi:hypothetical protein